MINESKHLKGEFISYLQKNSTIAENKKDTPINGKEKEMLAIINKDEINNPHYILQQIGSDKNNKFTRNSEEKTTNETSIVHFLQEITKEEFDQLPRQAEFNFRFNHQNNTYSMASLAIKEDKTQIYLKVPFDARIKMPVESLSYFTVSQDGKRLTYPPYQAEQQENNDFSTENNKPSYYVDNLMPRRFDIDKSEIARMGSEEVMNILRQIRGKELIIYTGAGISMDGEKPVWGMAQLKNQLGLNNPDSLFFKTFTDPKHYPPAELYQKFFEFRNQLFDDKSTPAHRSIANLARAIPDTSVFTENIDLKHEAEGSRIRAIHLDSDPNGFNKLKSRASTAKILLTAGLSQDDRAIIQYLKQQNPELKIISFTLSNETIPNYLDTHDAVVLGDVQQTLPEVASLLLSSKD